MYNLRLVMMKNYVLAVFITIMSLSLSALSDTSAGDGEAMYKALG